MHMDSAELRDLPPLVLFEDEHLLVINKPAGWNTHAPSPFAGEGVYDWLRHRERRWAALAIIHRLDKETSGVMVFAKTALANRSLTEQFAERIVRKRYVLVTDRPLPKSHLTVTSALVRSGERYFSRPLQAGAEHAQTRFRVLQREGDRTFVEAEPITGRTHQIRAHASDHGFPILGDTLYGGTPGPRVCLHSAEIRLRHPATQVMTSFTAPADFEGNAHLALRGAMISGHATNAYRVVHGAADGWPGWYLDRLGDFLLSQSEQPPSPTQFKKLHDLVTTLSCQGAYHKMLTRHFCSLTLEQTSPHRILGAEAPAEFVVRENSLRFTLSFREGPSVGLFLDQRDNRRRFLTRHVAGGFPLFGTGSGSPEVLNAFAYTCGFSVCAAKAGARVTSLDLSKKYLEWGKRNFVLNQLDPAIHDFIHADAFNWMHRLAKKKRSFDAVILDPPTFSRSKDHGIFRAEKDYGRLVAAALSVLKSNGLLLACTNAATVKPENFVEVLKTASNSAGRKMRQQHYAPQPPDFPINRGEPGYLKTVWLRIC